MKENNKGISMISLVIVIIILLILASITVYQANGLVNVAKEQAVKTDLLLIQAKVRIINEKVVFEKEDEKKAELLLGSQVSLEENTDTLNSLKSKNIITEEDDTEKYYILSQEDLTNMGLDSINADEGYIVNYESEEVIYLTGVKSSDGNYLYKLSEM